eukprot:4754570-Pyramimonas_sp.AAC.1
MTEGLPLYAAFLRHQVFRALSTTDWVAHARAPVLMLRQMPLAPWGAINARASMGAGSPALLEA